eukprot:GHVR01067747.1.p1 GENE.GHVR01067747.1~~GHVR01067747.1.p1  ORF type:complete len:323 (+),score=65.07 GHVR01067747.1:45-1013(+)
MLRQTTRLRKEYLHRKAVEDKEQSVAARKRKLNEILQENETIPTELRPIERELRKKVDLLDDVTKHVQSHIDDEYAYAGVNDPSIVITTARDPSTRLTQFAKEFKLFVPNSQRINRGNYMITDIIKLCRTNDISDIIILHEHRGNPDGMVVSHLPHGPTAYFSLSDVVLRHDLNDKPKNMSLVYPHLIFDNFTSKLGVRVTKILKYLFPPSAPRAQRVVSFTNSGDHIHMRNIVWSDTRNEKKRQPGDPHTGETEHIELTEVGPRFTLKPYKILLGTIEESHAEVEWSIRPYFNQQKAALTDRHANKDKKDEKDNNYEPQYI